MIRPNQVFFFFFSRFLLRSGPIRTNPTKFELVWFRWRVSSFGSTDPRTRTKHVSCVSFTFFITQLNQHPVFWLLQTQPRSLFLVSPSHFQVSPPPTAIGCPGSHHPPSSVVVSQLFPLHCRCCVQLVPHNLPPPHLVPLNEVNEEEISRDGGTHNNDGLVDTSKMDSFFTDAVLCPWGRCFYISLWNRTWRCAPHKMFGFLDF